MWHVPRPCAWTSEGKAGGMSLRRRSGLGILVGKYREIFWGRQAFWSPSPALGSLTDWRVDPVLPFRNLREAQTCIEHYQGDRILEFLKTASPLHWERHVYFSVLLGEAKQRGPVSSLGIRASRSPFLGPGT